MKSLIRLADKKGLLKGSLNVLQEEALQWLIIDNAELDAQREHERMKYTILAGNVQLWQYLFKDEEALEEYEVPDEEVEWFTPSSAEDIQAIESLLQGQNSETF